MRQEALPRSVPLAILLALVSTPAFAYIDPGTGSMLIQSLLAVVAAILVFGRAAWQRVKSLFGRDKKDDSRESGG